MPTHTCLCCGHTESFETADAAFEASWDVAPYLSLQPLCDYCMSASIPIYGLDEPRRLQAETHAHWKEHRRPTPIDAIAEPDQSHD
jgi:hypothetical protein